MIDRFHHVFIAADDFERSLGFYRDTLGWSVTRSWGEDGGERGAILSGGAIKVVIVQKSAGDGALHPAVHLDIHDVDKRFASIAKGEHVVAEPQETPWGTRWFVVRDPDGNEIAFEEVHRRGR